MYIALKWEYTIASAYQTIVVCIKHTQASIQEAVLHIDLIKPNTREINLFSDSQAVLKALDSCVDDAKTIMECRRSPNEMAKHYKIILIWVPGYQHIEGNCIADELARKGTTNEILQEKDTMGMPIVTCRLFIKQ